MTKAGWQETAFAKAFGAFSNVSHIPRITGDTPIGFKLIGATKKTKDQSLVSWLRNGVHFDRRDPDFAAERCSNLPIWTHDVLQDDLWELCVKNFGSQVYRGGLMQYEILGFIYPNEVIATHGIVREKTAVGQGWRFKVEVWADNEAGELKAFGFVEAHIDVRAGK